jgi:hypothetical protein
MIKEKGEGQEAVRCNIYVRGILKAFGWTAEAKSKI